MQKSFVERIFPSSSPLLPQHEHSLRQAISLPRSPSVSSSRRSSTPGKPHPSPLASQALQAPPLSASIIHHADPLLPIDRAAKSLERTIQSLLDAQSEGLLAGLGSGPQDEMSSTGSVTPTQSISTPSRRSAGPKVVPVRQPKEKAITLRGARRGLTRSMRDFALLKDEEVMILESQYQGRDLALKRAQAFDDKRAALETESIAVQEDSNSSVARGLRNEAQELDREIRELEDRLMEMKGRHIHMLNRANQLESSVDAKLSSYKSSIAMLDMEIRKFLRRPPVTQSLPDFNGRGIETGIYALKPERRTLEMAKEQWKAEQEQVAQRREKVETEQRALEDGAKMWHSAVQRINEFEKTLRAQTKSLSQSRLTPDNIAPVEGLLTDLSSLIDSLEVDLSQAESNEWNILICCLGAEVEALCEGRAILEQTLGIEVGKPRNGGPKSPNNDDEDEGEDAPGEGLIRYGEDANGGVLHSPGADSNASLEETLMSFGDGTAAETGASLEGGTRTENVGESEREDLQSSIRHQREISRKGAASSGSAKNFGFGQAPDSRSDTEDDDPGPSFLLSHS